MRSREWLDYKYLTDSALNSHLVAVDDFAHYGVNTSFCWCHWFKDLFVTVIVVFKVRQVELVLLEKHMEKHFVALKHLLNKYGRKMHRKYPKETVNFSGELHFFFLTSSRRHFLTIKWKSQILSCIDQTEFHSTEVWRCTSLRTLHLQLQDSEWKLFSIEMSVFYSVL